MNLSKVSVAAFAVTCILFANCEEGLDVEQRLATQNDPTASTARTTATLISDYELNGLEGDPITLETAQKWTANFQDKFTDGTRAHFFGFDVLNRILKQDDCVGIRMYYALDDDGNRQILLVGVNSKGENLIPSSSHQLLAEDNVIADASFPCPSFCPPTDF